jgi:hypothetical protein
MFALVLCGFSEMSGQEKGKKAAPKSQMPGEMSGRRVFRDPETGRLRPPEGDELTSLVQPRRTVPATILKLPKGLARITPFSEMNFLVVRRNPDGSLSSSCRQGLAAAERAVKESASSPEGKRGTR